MNISIITGEFYKSEVVMKEKRMIGMVSLYALSMLILFSLCVWTVWPSGNSVQGTASPEPVESETVYVYVELPAVTSEPTETVAVERTYFLVKSHEEKIGVFAEDGSLLEVFDVYIKSLPKADQRLLEEGVILASKDALNAIREDYTS